MQAGFGARKVSFFCLNIMSYLHHQSGEVAFCFIGYGSITTCDDKKLFIQNPIKKYSA